MSDFIRVSAIKESLTECPICKEHFNDSDRLPRRMPCCVQSICQPCLLELYNTRNMKISCPLCRHKHQLHGGVTSLPMESLILKILDHLKIQKGLRFPCTDCPDKNEAIARCDDCCAFLCEECHKSHARHRFSRNHKTVTFEEMKGRPLESFRRLHQCMEHQQAQQFYCFTCTNVICVSCTVVEHDKGKGHNVVSVDEAHQEKTTSTEKTLTKVDDKAQKLNLSVQDLQQKKKNIQKSRKKAIDDINQTFDKLIEVIQNRRAILLSDVEEKSKKDFTLTDQALDSTTLQTLLTKVRSSTEYTREMRGKADKIEDLQLMVSSADSLTAMLEESPQDVEFDRTGVSFVPHQEKQMTLLMESLGAVRSVTFKSTERPKGVLETDLYNGITLVPAELPEVPDLDITIPGGDRDIVCPHLEWDTTTASEDVTTSWATITNPEPDPPPPDTGCRIEGGRHVLTTRPMVIMRGRRVMYHLKIMYTVNQVLKEKKLIFESALTSSLVDANWNQPTGLSVLLVACTTHKQQLCLQMRYDNNILTDNPLTNNQVGLSYDLHLCFLLDKNTNNIHIVDVNDVRLIHTCTDVLFHRSLWVTMCLGPPSNISNVRGEIVSGNNITVTEELTELLFSFH